MSWEDDVRAASREGDFLSRVNAACYDAKVRKGRCTRCHEPKPIHFWVHAAACECCAVLCDRCHRARPGTEFRPAGTDTPVPRYGVHGGARHPVAPPPARLDGDAKDEKWLSGPDWVAALSQRHSRTAHESLVYELDHRLVRACPDCACQGTQAGRAVALQEREEEEREMEQQAANPACGVTFKSGYVPKAMQSRYVPDGMRSAAYRGFGLVLAEDVGDLMFDHEGRTWHYDAARRAWSVEPARTEDADAA